MLKKIESAVGRDYWQCDKCGCTYAENISQCGCETFKIKKEIAEDKEEMPSEVLGILKDSGKVNFYEFYRIMDGFK